MKQQVINQSVHARSRRAVRALVWLATLAGCGVDVEGHDEGRESEAQIGSVAQAFSSTYTYGTTCPQWKKDRAKTALDTFRQAIYDDSLLNCMRSRQVGGNQGADPVTYPEEVNRRLKQALNPHVECLQNGSTGSGAEYPNKLFIGELWFGTSGSFSSAQMAGLAGIIGHEMMHLKGYSDAPNMPNEWSIENRDFIIPQQVNGCLRDMIFDTGEREGAVRYDEIAASGETVLAAVGANGGTAQHPTYCGQNDFANGLTGRAGAHIDRLGLSCATGQQPSTYGGNGGNPFWAGCASGEIMVGVHGSATNVIHGIGPLCGSASQVLAGNYSEWDGAVAGSWGPADGYFRRWCPTGSAVKTLRMRTGALVDQIEIGCQRMSSPRSAAVLVMWPIGGANVDRTQGATCPGRGAVSSLTGHVEPGGGVGRISGLCKVVSNSAQNGAITVTDPSAATPKRHHLLSGIGSSGHSNDGFTEGVRTDCSGLLYGLAVRTDAHVRRIRGLCATNPTARSNGTETAAMRQSLAWIGVPTNGAETAAVCPDREFVVGWRVRHGWFIDSLEVYCRRF